MQRYGDNVSKDDLLAERPASGNPDAARVMFGGCGYGAGTFKKPPQSPRRSRFDLLARLGFKRPKAKEE
jgi:hypothetical protein